MKQKTYVLYMAVATIIFSCCGPQEKKVKINPRLELEEVDNLLSKIAEKPKLFTAPSNKVTTIISPNGTVIHVDPNRLETVDGSRLGENIQIELLEMTNRASMLLNNTQTMSNGRILVTGGAYYLNMTSDGKELKIKQEEGLEVKFPKLERGEMELFLGKKDSLGQINWVSLAQNLQKELDTSLIHLIINSLDTILLYQDEPLIPALLQGITELYPEHNIILPPMRINELTKRQIERYREPVNDVTLQPYREMYETVELKNFGWINCDRFLNDPNPKTNIQLLVNNDSLTGARIFALFKGEKSIMTEHYWKGRTDTAIFRNIPKGKELTIIALSVKGETSYFFETTINAGTVKQVEIVFVATSQTKIKEKILGIN